MFTVRESDIVVSAVVITGRMNNKIRCSDGLISIVRHGSFEQPLNRNSTLEMTSPHGAARSSMLLKSSKKEGRRINPLQVSPEGFHRN